MLIQLLKDYKADGKPGATIPLGTLWEVNEEFGLNLVRNGAAEVISYSSTTTNGLTDAQLRTSPVNVAITGGVELEFKNDTGNPLPITAANLTDGSQKTKLISDAGVVVDLTTQLAAILAKFTDHLQLTQVVKSDGTPVDFAAQFTALIAKFTDATQLVQSINVNGHPQSKPDFFDTTTSATIVYEGYKVGASVLLCKIDLTAGTRTWGTDTWANRVTATYA